MVSFSAIKSDHLAVLCPHCHLPMMRAAPMPIMFTDGLNNVAYHCAVCKTETVRTEKSDGSPHTVGTVSD